MSKAAPKKTSWELGAFLHSDLDDFGLDVYEFRIYLHLCRRIGDKDRVWEGQGKMAKICGISRRKVNETLQLLERRGFIVQHADHREEDGSRTTNKIEMCGLPPVTESYKVVQEVHTPHAPELQPPCTRVTTEGIPLEGNPLEVKQTPHLEAKSELGNTVSVSAIATPDASAPSEKTFPELKTLPKKSLTRELSLKLLEIWNANCGDLPRADRLNPSRDAGFYEVFREYECNGEETGAALVQAVKCVAADPFWQERKYGLDNLLREGVVTSKAEKFRSSTPKVPSRREIELETLTTQHSAGIVIGSRWEHPGTKKPLQVLEINNGTVFFADGGPLEEIWLSHMAGWKLLEDIPKDSPGTEFPKNRGVA